MDLATFAETHLGMKLLPHQRELLAMIEKAKAEGRQVAFVGGRRQGMTAVRRAMELAKISAPHYAESNTQNVANLQLLRKNNGRVG